MLSYATEASINSSKRCQITWDLECPKMTGMTSTSSIMLANQGILESWNYRRYENILTRKVRQTWETDFTKEGHIPVTNRFHNCIAFENMITLVLNCSTLHSQEHYTTNLICY